MMYDIIHHMKRTTVFLPDSLQRQLQLFARRAGKPVAAVVREALMKHLDSQREPFWMPPTFSSGRSDISERIDELLFAGVDAHGEPLAKSKSKRR
jgi:hypothetical protein